MFLIAICHSAVMLMTPWRGTGVISVISYWIQRKASKQTLSLCFSPARRRWNQSCSSFWWGRTSGKSWRCFQVNVDSYCACMLDKYFMITTLQHIWLWFAAECFSPTVSSTTSSDIWIGMLNSQRFRFSSFRDRFTLRSLSVHLVRVLFIRQLTFSIFTWVEVILLNLNNFSWLKIYVSSSPHQLWCS